MISSSASWTCEGATTPSGNDHDRQAALRLLTRLGDSVLAELGAEPTQSLADI